MIGLIFSGMCIIVLLYTWWYVRWGYDFFELRKERQYIKTGGIPIIAVPYMDTSEGELIYDVVHYHLFEGDINDTFADFFNSTHGVNHEVLSSINMEMIPTIQQTKSLQTVVNEVEELYNSVIRDKTFWHNVVSRHLTFNDLIGFNCSDMTLLEIAYFYRLISMEKGMFDDSSSANNMYYYYLTYIELSIRNMMIRYRFIGTHNLFHTMKRYKIDGETPFDFIVTDYEVA